MKLRVITLGLVVATVFGACQGGISKEKAQQMQDSFATVISNKDAELESLFQQMNEIETSLQEVANTYSDVAQATNTSGEVSKDSASSIKSKISTINDILAANKKKISAINNSLYKSQKQNKELKKFVENLESRIKEQEEQIQVLTAELEKKNIKIDELTKNVENLQNTAKEKDKQLMAVEDEKHTAYFAIGTKKELRAKNLIDKRGGFIGLGTADVLANNADFSVLTKIDTRNTQEIPLTGEKIKIVTAHPTSSYSLEGDEKRPTSIRITNPDLFWKASKCLVIMVD